MQKVIKEIKGKEGFTLVELAIVLVIIGLIVSGVLVGQDLIKSAQTRSQMSQLESFDAAFSTFRGKYNGLPGDLSSSLATTFGFRTRAGTVGQGDGNGIITTSDSTDVVCGETALAFQDLGTAGLIQGSYPDGRDGAVGACGLASTTAGNILPAGRLGGFIAVYDSAGRNVLQVSGMTIASTATGVVAATAVLQNIQAYNIDTKMDDGLPTTGRVRAMDAGALNDTTYTDDLCVDTTPGTPTYSVVTTDANSIECGLQMATSL